MTDMTAEAIEQRFEAGSWTSEDVRVCVQAVKKLERPTETAIQSVLISPAMIAGAFPDVPDKMIPMVRLSDHISTVQTIQDALTYHQMRAAELIAERDAMSIALDRLKVENATLRAQLDQAPCASSTYGDLYQKHPILADCLESHEWDNMNAAEQRDWALKQADGHKSERFKEAIEVRDVIQTWTTRALNAEAQLAQKPKCKYGDSSCPCQDGDPCHYEGKDPMTPPHALAKIAELEAALERQQRAITDEEDAIYRYPLPGTKGLLFGYSRQDVDDLIASRAGTEKARSGEGEALSQHNSTLEPNHKIGVRCKKNLQQTPCIPKIP